MDANGDRTTGLQTCHLWRNQADTIVSVENACVLSSITDSAWGNKLDARQ
jgi:hypothetical protein